MIITNAKEVQFNGRRFIVADATLIVAGVLHGSKGPLLYQLPEITNSVASWSGAPVTVGHPQSRDGKPLSGRRPEVFAKWGIGVVNNPRVENGRLQAQLFLDVELVRRIAPQIISRLKAGQALEVSTGLNVDQAVANGIWINARGQSVAYTAVATNFRPDHLAVLLNQEGACSLQDGCGANRRVPA